MLGPYALNPEISKSKVKPCSLQRARHICITFTRTQSTCLPSKACGHFVGFDVECVRRNTTEIAVSLGGMPEASEFEAFLVFRTGVKVSVACETPSAFAGGRNRI